MAEPVTLSSASPLGAAKIRARLAVLLGFPDLTEEQALDLLDEAFLKHTTSLWRHYGISLEIPEPTPEELLEHIDWAALEPHQRDRVRALILPSCRLVREVGFGCTVVMVWQGDGLRVHAIEDLGCHCKCTEMA